MVIISLSVFKNASWFVFYDVERWLNQGPVESGLARWAAAPNSYSACSYTLFYSKAYLGYVGEAKSNRAVTFRSSDFYSSIVSLVAWN